MDEGKVTEADIDLACRRVLEAKYKLGLLDDPYRYIDETRLKRIFYRGKSDGIASGYVPFVCVAEKMKQVLPAEKSGTIALVWPVGQ